VREGWVRFPAARPFGKLRVFAKKYKSKPCPVGNCEKIENIFELRYDISTMKKAVSISRSKSIFTENI